MNKAILVIATLGLGFSGYLSSFKLFSDTCALGESCPYFLGLPACYYGFVMYLFLTLFAYLLVFKRVSDKTGLKVISAISFIGILFAGYFTLGELPKLFALGLKAYVLGLPTCALGLVFYIIIFILATKSKNN
jgi:uncharacterized membrane protein